ncbi:MAG: GNAT family N-acetyltransferase [Xanthomonadales bacterium]|nr:GNAT family N-acetyltransferase [Xanthomonadales bacterium]
MSSAVVYRLNGATDAEIGAHLRACDSDFIPSLCSRIEIDDYAFKIASNALRFEAWSQGVLIGLVAGYCNDRGKQVAYITSVSVLKDWTGKGIAAQLISRFVEHARNSGMQRISLQVGQKNLPAIRLYEKHGFSAVETNQPFIDMDLHLDKQGGA